MEDSMPRDCVPFLWYARNGVGARTNYGCGKNSSNVKGLAVTLQSIPRLA